jgi:dTDP-glucose 4,6-dehydratase
MPHLANHAFIQWIKGDIRTFDFPLETFDYLIHAATDTLSRCNYESQQREFDTMIVGTKRVLEFARLAKVRKLLFTSSGAVYGKQDSANFPVSEDCLLSPDPLSQSSSYGIGKLASEHLCLLHALDTGCEISIARCFAFIGPHLPLNQGYAIGNFLRDGLNGEPIRFAADGQSVRSFLHAADLMIWLWTLLFKAEGCRAYNVGSANALTIAQLAEIVANSFSLSSQSCPTGDQPEIPSLYVPDVTRASIEHKLQEKILLPEAIRRTSQWYLTN